MCPSKDSKHNNDPSCGRIRNSLQGSAQIGFDICAETNKVPIWPASVFVLVVFIVVARLWSATSGN